MRKERAIILALATLTLGLTVGILGSGKLSGGIQEATNAASQLDKAYGSLITLRRLRAADPASAIEIAEARLDTALIELGIFLREQPKSKLDEELHEMFYGSLSVYKRYRSEYPRKTKMPHVDSMVADTFALLDKQSPH